MEKYRTWPLNGKLINPSYKTIKKSTIFLNLIIQPKRRVSIIIRLSEVLQFTYIRLSEVLQSVKVAGYRTNKFFFDPVYTNRIVTGLWSTGFKNGL
jgi:hypothetical protein